MSKYHDAPDDPNPCQWCENARTKGYFGSDAPIHCRACGASWTGLTRQHCTGCHRTFTSTTAGDKHKQRDDCLSDRELGRKGLKRSKNQFDHWLWSMATDEEMGDGGLAEIFAANGY